VAGRCAIGREESIFNFDMAAFYTKWLRDIRESQKEDGSISDVVPLIGSVILPTAMGNRLCRYPWNLYLYYDDERILEENLPLGQSWVDYLTSINVDILSSSANTAIGVAE